MLGLSIQRKNFLPSCSKDIPCFLRDTTKDNYPCIKCIVKYIDADKWLHNDHLCTGSTCGNKETLEEKRGLSRRTQHYGYEYSYKKMSQPLKKTKALSSNLAIAVLAEILAPNFPEGKAPTQCIVNEYVIGQGIAPHIDNLCFGPTVITISLISSCTMEISSKNKQDFRLNSGDIVLLQDDSRYAYKHSIKNIKCSDCSDKDPRRVSVTFRTLSNIE
jgi:alkylated DNA repair dioxygenase AlkB